MFGALDIGLPVGQLEQALHEAIANGATTEAILDAVDRRGRVMKCRAKVAPLVYRDRSTKGAVVLLEDCTIIAQLP